MYAKPAKKPDRNGKQRHEVVRRRLDHRNDAAEDEHGEHRVDETLVVESERPELDGGGSDRHERRSFATLLRASMLSLWRMSTRLAPGVQPSTSIAA